MLKQVPDRFKQIRAVLFDLDGTLVDSAPDLGAAADKMRVDRGLASLPLSHYRCMAGSGARGMLGVAFGIEPEHAEFAGLRDEFFNNYEQSMTQRTFAFEGASEVIAYLVSAQMPWGVVTNKATRFALPLTRSMSLFDSAKTLVCGDTTAHTKPHPAPLLEAARRLDMAPADCLYVGDDERDILAGLAAGMGTVAACYGYLGRAAQPSAWGAHAQINSLSALLQLLCRH